MITEWLAEVEPVVVVWCGIALFSGAFVKGVLGVGLPMISVPLMSLVIPPPVAAALVILTVFPANIIQVRSGGPLKEKIRRFGLIAAVTSIAIVLGAWFLLQADPRLMQVIVGTIVGVFTFQRIRKVKISVPRRHETWIGMLLGSIGGFFGGVAMMFGPIMVMFMTSLGLQRDEFVGSIAFVYLVTGATVIVSLTGFSVMTPAIAAGSVLACVPVIAGVFIGSRARKHIDQPSFERFLTFMLVLISASLLLRAMGWWPGSGPAAID